jgi:pimeloyl-ACP methyl ester carboxylesterase
MTIGWSTGWWCWSRCYTCRPRTGWRRPSESARGDLRHRRRGSGHAGSRHRLAHAAQDLEEEARQHLTAAADGRVRFRYSKSAAVAAWGETSWPPVPPAGVPTLIVVGTESWVPVEEHLERYRAALGDRLVVERLPSQDWLLWNAFPATADAVRAFV